MSEEGRPLVGREPAKGRWRGLGLAGCSAFLVSTCSMISKLCCALPPGQLYFAGSLGILLTGLFLALVARRPLFPKGYRAYLLGYSAFATNASMASYQAIRLMPLSDEALLAYNNIPFTSVLACLLLKEPCGPRQVVSCSLVVAGLLMVCQPSLDRTNYPYYLVGAGVSLASSLCDSFSYILIKRLHGLHFSVIMFNLGAMSVFCSSLMSLLEDWVRPSSAHFLFTFVSLFVLYETYFTLALESERAGVVALVQATDIVFAYLWELAYFNEEYNSLKISGSVLIMTVIVTSVLTRDT